MDLTELRETARLARLSMDEDELRMALPAFEQMLSFFAVMREADVFGILPDGETAETRSSLRAGCFRTDTVSAPTEQDTAETFLAQAGERADRFITVPNVLPESV